MKKILPLLLGLLLSTGFSAQASEQSSRLERIKENKTIILGYYETGIPYSFLDNNGVQGFGAELSQRIAKSIQQHLGLDELKIRWNPMTVSTRIALVNAGQIDIECTSTSHKSSREQYVDFSNTFFVSSDAFAARADSGIKQASDLVGKRVAVVADSRNQTNALKLGIAESDLVKVKNNQRAMQAVEAGEADAFFSNVGLVSREMLRVKDSSPYVVYSVGTNASPYACMLPKGDPEIKKIADNTIAEMMNSGEMQKLFNKWFNGPIPPYNRSANVQMDEKNLALYADPNDNFYK